MSSHRDAIDELIGKAEELGEGPAQVALCEEAVRIADAHNDAEAGWLARRELTKAATFGGRPDVALVSFSWCLAQADRDPQRFDEAELLWEYKWVIESVSDFPAIPRPQIEELFADMAARYRRHGSTMHAVHQCRREVAVSMCDRAGAEAAHALATAARRDHLSNCLACVQDSMIEYHLFLGDDAAAVDAARPILDGKMRCGEVPHRTYPLVLLPLVRLGKPERAARYYKAGYKLVRPNAKFVRHKAYVLAFLSVTGNLDRAARVFERHLPEALDVPSLWARFEFYAAARLFLDRLTAGKAVPMLAVPEPLRQDGKLTRPASEVVPWLDAQVADLARQFDARNGNDGFARRAQWFRDQAQHATDFPVDT